MKHLYKPATLMFLLLTLLLSCKKSSTTPALVTFMKLDANGKALVYNSCFTTEIVLEGQPETTITSQGGTGNFSITLNQDPNNLKTGQVYEALSITSLATDSYATFTYTPDTTPDGGYGYPSSPYNPIGTVTLTEVTPTSIKGTFSAGVCQNYFGPTVAYNITNGTFCSGNPAYSVAISGD